MKNKLAKAAGAVLFLAGLFGIMTFLSAFLKPDGEDVFDSVAVEQKKQDIDLERENSIDVVFSGDSLSYSAFSPVYMWEKYGFTSYVAGISAQRICDGYDILKHVFVKQSPKVVVLEANCLFSFSDFDAESDDKVEVALSKVFSVIKHHSRWKLIYKGMENSRAHADELHNKGFRLRENVVPYKGGDYMIETSEKETIAECVVSYVEKIQSLCKENGAELVLVSTPSALCWSYKKHNAVKEFAEERNILFVDCNLDTDINIDWLRDTKDAGNHLNFSGAVKVSGYIADLLDKYYDLPDHRDNPEYSDWINIGNQTV